ncbi:ROK family protein [Rhodanobacter glycinis]|uniref:ROK family protein n=1 Tax=Rhodanobacter glycinis TaxID=582702 RepID=A0A502CJE1_9GAMM|nr:ROK family protein [Rhodanobacter glycinis]TPG46910.1 ROK family protein [Rhodanobacter glycinis]
MDLAITHPDPPARVAALPFLAADVGGTFARVALMQAPHDEGREPEVLAYRKLACAQFDGLAALLQSFVDSDAETGVRHCVLACAGHVKDDEVLNDNSPWPIHLSQLRQSMALDHVAVLNDFEALGYALGNGPASGSRLLCGPAARTQGSVLVIGPGTGLGAAVRLPASAGGHVLATEAGQMDFAPGSVRERELLAYLAPHGGYVAYERIVSGPGLLTSYAALCALRGETPRLATPEEVTAAAAACSDAQAVEAVQIFCASLGSFAGSLAMTFMTTGGVYLAGGFLHSMFALLEHSAFEERFLHGRSVRAFLSQVPVWVTEHGRHGVLGAAQWYLRHGVPQGARQASTKR